MAGIAAQRRKRFACSLCGGRQLTLTRTSVVASAYLPSACTRAHQSDLTRPPITGPGFAIWRPRLKPRSAFGVDTCVLVPGVYCISPSPSPVQHTQHWRRGVRGSLSSKRRSRRQRSSANDSALEANETDRILSHRHESGPASFFFSHADSTPQSSCRNRAAAETYVHAPVASHPARTYGRLCLCCGLEEYY